MTIPRPLVSVGMPVYNAEAFLQETLESILSQDYEHFEVIISDNASADASGEICRKFSDSDRRLRYHRNQTNLGAVVNFNRVLEYSRGTYFMWAGDHDLWRPSFISRCVALLEAEPDVVLAYPRTMLIDQHGKPVNIMPDRIDTRGRSTIDRYKYVIWNLSLCNMVYGLMRRDQLAEVGCRNVWAGDKATLAGMALRGAFAQIPEPLFLRRKNRPDEGEDEEEKKPRVLQALDPATADAKGRLTIEELDSELGCEHLRIVMAAPISWFDKVRLTLSTLRCFQHRYGVRWHRLLARRMTASGTWARPNGPRFQHGG